MYQFTRVVQSMDFRYRHPAYVSHLICGGSGKVNRAVMQKQPILLDVLEKLTHGGVHQFSLCRVKFHADFLFYLADGARQAVFPGGDAAANALPFQREGRATRCTLTDEPLALAVLDPHMYYQMVALRRQLGAADVDLTGWAAVTGIQIPKIHGDTSFYGRIRHGRRYSCRIGDCTFRQEWCIM